MTNKQPAAVPGGRPLPEAVRAWLLGACGRPPERPSGDRARPPGSGEPPGRRAREPPGRGRGGADGVPCLVARSGRRAVSRPAPLVRPGRPPPHVADHRRRRPFSSCGRAAAGRRAGSPWTGNIEVAVVPGHTGRRGRRPDGQPLRPPRPRGRSAGALRLPRARSSRTPATRSTPPSAGARSARSGLRALSLSKHGTPWPAGPRCGRGARTAGAGTPARRGGRRRLCLRDVAPCQDGRPPLGEAVGHRGPALDDHAAGDARTVRGLSDAAAGGRPRPGAPHAPASTPSTAGCASPGRLPPADEPPAGPLAVRAARGRRGPAPGPARRGGPPAFLPSATPAVRDGGRDEALPAVPCPLLVRDRDDVVAALGRRGVVVGYVYTPRSTITPAPGSWTEPVAEAARGFARHALPADPLDATAIAGSPTGSGPRRRTSRTDEPGPRRERLRQGVNQETDGLRVGGGGTGVRASRRPAARGRRPGARFHVDHRPPIATTSCAWPRAAAKLGNSG